MEDAQDSLWPSAEWTNAKDEMDNVRSDGNGIMMPHFVREKGIGTVE